MVCPHGQGRSWVEPVRIFCEQRGGVNFSRFCADVFYGRSLIDFLIKKIKQQYITLCDFLGNIKYDMLFAVETDWYYFLKPIFPIFLPIFSHLSIFDWSPILIFLNLLTDIFSDILTKHIGVNCLLPRSTAA